MGAGGAVAAIATPIEEAGRRAGRGEWIATRAFELAGRAAAIAPEARVRVHLGVAARRHGSHVVAWHGLLPALVHLDAGALVGAPETLDRWWATVLAGADAGGEEQATRLFAAHGLLVREALGVHRGWLAAATPWTDAPERRVLVQVVRDLEELDAGGAALGGSGPPQAWAGALVEAGGLAVGVPNTLR